MNRIIVYILLFSMISGFSLACDFDVEPVCMTQGGEVMRFINNDNWVMPVLWENEGEKGGFFVKPLSEAYFLVPNKGNVNVEVYGVVESVDTADEICRKDYDIINTVKPEIKEVAADVQEVPEFSTITAGFALFGAAALYWKKRLI